MCHNQSLGLNKVVLNSIKRVYSSIRDSTRIRLIGLGFKGIRTYESEEGGCNKTGIQSLAELSFLVFIVGVILT